MKYKFLWVIAFGFCCFMYGMFAEGYNHNRIAPGHLWVICGWIGVLSFVALIAPDKK